LSALSRGRYDGVTEGGLGTKKGEHGFYRKLKFAHKRSIARKIESDVAH